MCGQGAALHASAIASFRLAGHRDRVLILIVLVPEGISSRCSELFCRPWNGGVPRLPLFFCCRYVVTSGLRRWQAIFC